MRQFQPLDHVAIDESTGIIEFTATASAAAPAALNVSMRREGEYVALSATYGPVEIALRPRLNELLRTLGHIKPNDGLSTTRQVGSGNTFLALGQRTDGSLILRPTLVGDASGYFCLNLVLAPDLVAALTQWLGR